jgi:Domain of unknown function (DUF1840)
MLVTFHSKAWSGVTMFGDVAVTLLKMTGHSGTVPSVPRAGDIPAALARLKQELAAAGPEEESKQSVRSGCRRRALPGFRLVAVAGPSPAPPWR